MTVFYFKQKTAYEIRISDWSSDVCSSDLPPALRRGEIDVGLLLSPVPSDGLQLDALRSEGWLVAMPSDHRLADYEMIAKFGRAPCRDKVCQYVYITVAAVILKKKIIQAALTYAQEYKTNSDKQKGQ